MRDRGLVKRVCFDGRGAYAAEWEEYRIIDDDALIAQFRPLESEAVNKSDFRIAVSHALVAHWREDTELLAALRALPGQLRQAFALDWSPLVAGLANMHDLFVLGRGYGLAAAQEEELIRGELQREMVQQILRRLETIAVR